MENDNILVTIFLLFWKIKDFFPHKNVLSMLTYNEFSLKFLFIYLKVHPFVKSICWLSTV